MNSQCDLKCPPIRKLSGFTPCCSNCNTSRKQFAIDNNLLEHWDEKDGFASHQGCKLPREQRPEKCNKYDCKNYRFYVSVQWIPELGNWIIMDLCERKITMIDDEFCDRFMALIKEGNNE